MSKIEEKVVDQIQCILELWRVTYNVEDEKYIAKTNSMVVLNPEQIEWISKLGLSIFSVQKYEDTLTVIFSSGGCSC